MISMYLQYFEIRQIFESRINTRQLIVVNLIKINCCHYKEDGWGSRVNTIVSAVKKTNIGFYRTKSDFYIFIDQIERSTESQVHKIKWAPGAEIVNSSPSILWDLSGMPGCHGQELPTCYSSHLWNKKYLLKKKTPQSTFYQCLVNNLHNFCTIKELLAVGQFSVADSNLWGENINRELDIKNSLMWLKTRIV